MRDKIRHNEYVVTYHARKEMNDDNYSIFDVEKGVLTGEIMERQQDNSTAESKYRIRGKTFDGVEIELICKISPTNRLVIITVYEL
ncbi:DUF4258 domain-containing protein [candidate division KSB1 bacterium]|nr:DUF4258 domain-containing protein [candidate division KSB1 bacterium]